MKKISMLLMGVLFVALTVVSTSCKDACDDLEDVCDDCNADYKSSCKAELSACDLVKGPAGKDCCEAYLSYAEEMCE